MRYSACVLRADLTLHRLFGTLNFSICTLIAICIFQDNLLGMNFKGEKAG